MPKPSIAVVAHQATVRTAIRVMLRATGYEVASFDGDKEFLESLSGQQPDCLILQPTTSDRFALDMLSKMKADRISIPTILVVGGGDEDLEKRAAQLGVRRVLRMPFLDDLRFVIDSMLLPDATRPSVAKR